MKIILAPTKRMVDNSDDFSPSALPVYLDKTKELAAWLNSKNHDELKKIWACNESILQENLIRLQQMDLDHPVNAALFSFEGLAFQHLAPGIMEQQQLDYLQDHLRILSGFYGILKPMDGICLYRLEMGNKYEKDLYQFWSDDLYKQLKGQTIINLASKEYSKAVEPYLKANDRMVTIDFKENVNGRLITKATLAKMARGEMVRFMAENQIEEVRGLKDFKVGGYLFREDLSTDDNYVFVRTPKQNKEFE